MSTYTPITLNDLTTATVDGGGVFDVLMRANKVHLEQEFLAGRIKGNEYATVYLGSLQSVLQTALQFTLQKEAQNLDFLIKSKQVDLAIQQIALAQQEVAVAIAKLANIPKEGALLDAQVIKLEKDAELAIQQIAVAEKEVLIKEQQVLVSQAEVAIAQAKLVNIPKEGALLDAQTATQTQQVLNLGSEKLRIDAQTANLAAEALNIPKLGLKIDADVALTNQQKLNLVSEELRIDAQTALTSQQAANAVIEGTVLTAQECKLRGEFDKIVAETGMVVDLRQKTASETNLLDQKKVTEMKQALVTEKQIGLIEAQALAFDKDYQVKMQDLRVKAWATARTTDPDSVPLMNF